MIFKKPKQKIIWDYLASRPSATFAHADFVREGRTIEDYLIPTSKMTPEWFKSLKQTKNWMESYPTAKTCPSFIELFKNSYLFIAPCDIACKVSSTGIDFLMSEEGWLQTQSHTAHKPPVFTNEEAKDEELVKRKMASLNQMGDKWDRYIHNIKFETGIVLGVNHGEFTFMQLPAYWHNQRPVLFTPPGTTTVTADTPSDLQLNTFIDFKPYIKDGETIEKTYDVIHAGDPIAMIYLPGGFLNHEKGKINKRLRKKFMGGYAKQLKEFRAKEKEKGKCPFPFLHK